MYSAPADCPSTFAPAVHYGVGLEPYAVAIADFNGDGRPDVATANYSNHTISIRTGLANGTLSAAATTISTGNSPSAIATADFNGDNKPDLVTTCLGSSAVCVRLNTTSGGSLTFSANTQYVIPALPYHVAIGDVNGDSRPDLVTANGFGNSISVLTGNANGTFQAPVDFSAGPAGTQPECVALGDVDGDGKLDALTANYAAGTVSCMRGSGNGSFAAPIESVGIDSLARSLCAADFNNDGAADVAIVSADNPGPVTILLSLGDGTFGAPIDYAAGVSAGVAAGDLNRDGRVDLAVAKNYFGGPGQVAVLLGHGDGSFAQAVDYSTESGPSGVAIADMNGDSWPDLAVTNHFSSSVSILLSQTYSNAAINSQPADQTIPFGGQAHFSVGTTGQGPFQYQWRHNGAPIADGGHYSGTTAATLTVSGATTFETGTYDVLVYSSCSTELRLASQSAHLNLMNEPGSHGCAPSFSPSTFGTPDDPQGIAVGDIDGDGHLDLLTANFEGLGVTAWLSNGAGGFGPGLNSFVQGEPSAAVIGEFNRDGIPDVAIALHSGASVMILAGNGDGSFVYETSYGTNIGPIAITAADLNNDGFADIVSASYDGNSVSVMLSNAQGFFDVSSPLVVGQHPHGVAVDDLNGDGVLDIAVANEASNSASILLGTGGGNFAAAVNYAAGASPASIAIGDLNGDGRADLAVANQSDGKISVLAGNGDGSFAAPTSYTVGAAPVFVAIGDFNSDGLPDVAAANHDSNNVAMLSSLPSGGLSSPLLVNVANGPQALVIDDLDGDGRLDIAVANEIANSVSVLVNSGQSTGFNPQPVNISVPAGGTATFTATAIGTGPFRYQWRRNGVPIVGATSNTLTIASASAADVAAYDVQVRGGCNPNTITTSHPAALCVGPAGSCRADINYDGLVDLLDLTILLSNFGFSCP